MRKDPRAEKRVRDIHSLPRLPLLGVLQEDQATTIIYMQRPKYRSVEAS